MNERSEKVKQIYEKFIGKKLNPLIIKYDIFSHTFDYHPYRHDFSLSTEVNLAQLLFDNLIFYAFEDDEIINEYEENRLIDIRKASINAYFRVPKTERQTDGLLGELLLDSLLKNFHPQTQAILSRVLYIERRPEIEKDNKIETKGYDSIMFSKHENEISLWLGQVKTGDWNYCKKSIQDDLNKNILKEYFAGHMLIFADQKRADKKSELYTVLNDINEIYFRNGKKSASTYEEIIQYIKSKNIQIIMPALLLYPYGNYYDNECILKDIEEKCKSQLDSTKIENKEGLIIKVMFMVFPVRNLEEMRSELLKIRTSLKEDKSG